MSGLNRLFYVTFTCYAKHMEILHLNLILRFNFKKQITLALTLTLQVTTYADLKTAVINSAQVRKVRTLIHSFAGA